MYRLGLSRIRPGYCSLKYTAPTAPAGDTSIANMILKLDASIEDSLFQDSAGTIPVTANGQRVGLWRDQSGNGNDVLQATDDNRPYFHSDGLNGGPAIDFRGDPDYLRKYLTSASLLDATYNTNFAVFVVYNSDTTAGWRVVADMGGGNRARIGYQYEAGINYLEHSQLTTAYHRPGAQLIGSEHIKVLGISYDGTAVKTINNGYYHELAATGNLGLSGAITLGVDSGLFDTALNGCLRMFYLYKTGCTEDEMRDMCSWLMSQAGVTQPTLRQILAEGDSLTGGPSDANWVLQLNGSLGSINQFYQNNGIAGTSLMYVNVNDLAHYITDGVSRNICVLWLGSNDIADQFENFTVAQIEAGYTTFCNSLHTLGFDAVVVTTILPRSGGTDNPNTETRRQTFNTWLRANWSSIAEALSDVAADTNIGDAGDNLDTTYYQADAVHLNGIGEGIVEGIMETAVESVLV